jgi:hypothetical protein
MNFPPPKPYVIRTFYKLKPVIPGEDGAHASSEVKGTQVVERTRC